jgi:NAD(P)-dependent dehydrogenase (short-subunit alcohol dehydrogenase family)
VCGNLGDPQERDRVAEEIAARCDGRLDGLVTSAGIGGSTRAQGGTLVSVNYFGTVRLLERLRPVLAAGAAAQGESAEGEWAHGESAVVCLGSNAATCQPNWPADLAEACLAGDEELARQAGERHLSFAAYAATKAAIAWYVRLHAPTPEWAGANIRLNAIAPGLIETALTAAQREDPVLGKALDAFPIPRGRAGRPEEAAALIDFLLGPDAALLCGSVVYADGGTDALLRARDWPARWQV